MFVAAGSTRNTCSDTQQCHWQSPKPTSRKVSVTHAQAGSCALSKSWHSRIVCRSTPHSSRTERGQPETACIARVLYFWPHTHRGHTQEDQDTRRLVPARTLQPGPLHATRETASQQLQKVTACKLNSMQAGDEQHHACTQAGDAGQLLGWDRSSKDRS
jgi:hypothetical protein